MTGAHLKTLIMREKVIWFQRFFADVVTVCIKNKTDHTHLTSALGP